MIFNPVVPIAKKIETIQARDIAVGSSVYLNEDGNYAEYLVVNQGIPSNSNLYDGSCNGTWLLRKDIHSNQRWGVGDNDYSNSVIENWLNTTFFNTLGETEQAVIKQVKIPYSTGGVATSDTTKSGSDGLSCKIFLLSGGEMGWTKTDSQYLSGDGASLSYKSYVAYLDGTASIWMLRSTYWNSANNIAIVTATGALSATNYTVDYGARPALILPFNAEFDKTNMRLVGVGGLGNF